MEDGVLSSSSESNVNMNNVDLSDSVTSNDSESAGIEIQSYHSMEDNNPTSLQQHTDNNDNDNDELKMLNQSNKKFNIETGASTKTPIKAQGGDLKETLAGLAGNVLEWYDFAVFGYFSDVIGVVFFPPQEGNANLVQSFAVFGGAFIMRPFGGMLQSIYILIDANITYIDGILC